MYGFLNILVSQFIDFIITLKNWFIWVLGSCLGLLLTLIGYPKEVLVAIFVLMVFDTLTKFYSIVVINYGSFTFKNYRKAWKERNLSSRGLKTGWGIKVILYFPMLIFAEQFTIGKEAISNILYGVLLIVEFKSILENFEDCGCSNGIIKILLSFLKNKEKEMFKNTSGGEDTKGDDDSNVQSTI